MSEMNNISLGTSASTYLTLNGNRNFCFILCRYTDEIFERDCKGKMKGGTDWKLITLALDRDPWKLYLMFPSREIDKKNCVKIIRKFIYVKFRTS